MADSSQYYGDDSSSRSYHGGSNDPGILHEHAQSEVDETGEAEAAAVPPDSASYATAPEPKRLKIGDWDKSEVDKLLYLKKHTKMKWREIGAEIGRTAAQCSSQYDNIMNNRSRKHKSAQTSDHRESTSTGAESAMRAQPASTQKRRQRPSSSSGTSGSLVWVPAGMQQGPIYHSPSGVNPWRPEPEGEIDWDVYGLKELINEHGPRIERDVFYNLYDREKGWAAVAAQCLEHLGLEVEGEELRERWEEIKEEKRRHLQDAGGEGHNAWSA